MNCDNGTGGKSVTQSAAEVINGLAAQHLDLSRRRGVRAFRAASAIGAAVDRIHDMHGDDLFAFLSHDAIATFYPARLPEKDGNKYPWGLLQKANDRFLWPNPGVSGETLRQKRASIAASACQKFGRGVVRTKLVPSGILVTRIA